MSNILLPNQSTFHMEIHPRNDGRDGLLLKIRWANGAQSIGVPLNRSQIKGMAGLLDRWLVDTAKEIKAQPIVLSAG